MFQQTQPAALDAGGRSDDWAEFRVDHPIEVLALLRRLRDRVEPVTLAAPGGHTLGTSLWAIDEGQQRVNLAVDPEHPVLPPLIEADEVTAVAYLDSVKLQFDLRDLLVVRAARAAALQATLPRTLYRFQRRQAYRVRPGDSSAPTVRLRHPSMPEMALALRVLDVSAGGCAVLLPQDVPPLQPGTRIASAAIVLDGDTRFETSLVLQHVTALHPDQGGVRIGCAWLDLGPSAARALQLYIDQTQKRRRLLSLD